MLGWQWTETPDVGPSARVVTVWCHHGRTSLAVVPGHTVSDDRAVVDIVRVCHAIRHGCDCAGLDQGAIPCSLPADRAGRGSGDAPPL